MKQIVFCVALLSIAGADAQVSDARKYAATITADDLRKHLFVIASDSMEGRETASEGLNRAAAYIENHFRNSGLTGAWMGSFQQKFPVYRDSLSKTTLAVAGVELKRDTDYAVSYNSGFNISLRSGEVLFAGYGNSDSVRDDYKNINARGKIVLVMPGAPPVVKKGKKIPGTAPDLSTLQEAAAKNGATALLIVSSRLPRAPMPAQGGLYFHDYRKDNLPNTFFVSDSVAKLILGTDYALVKKTMKTGAPAPKSYFVNTIFELEKITEQLESMNVLGMIEGSEKNDEALIITAHLDHLGKRDSVIYYGADDDGSGTVTILELAEAFSRAAADGKKPRRNIIFMTVSGEEKGLWGSAHYAESPSIPLEKISANINIDMIGRIESGRKDDSLNYIYVVGDNRISSDLRKISEDVNHQTHKLSLDYKFNDPADPQRIYYRSDHYNFAKYGVPALFYFSGLHEDYHRPTDTPDKIRYELLAKRAQLIFYTAWEISNRDELLKRDIE